VETKRIKKFHKKVIYENNISFVEYGTFPSDYVGPIGLPVTSRLHLGSFLGGRVGCLAAAAAAPPAAASPPADAAAGG
jgi:hypothetical protein